MVFALIPISGMFEIENLYHLLASQPYLIIDYLLSNHYLNIYDEKLHFLPFIFREIRNRVIVGTARKIL